MIELHSMKMESLKHEKHHIEEKNKQMCLIT